MMFQARKTIMSSRDRLQQSKAKLQMKQQQSILLLLFVLTTTLLISSGDPSYDMPSSISLMGNVLDGNDNTTTTTNETSSTTTQQQSCPVGIWNKTTHLLDVNANCTNSQELLHMPRPETNKTLTYMLLYYNNHGHLAQQINAWKNYSRAALDQTQFLIIDDGSTPGHTAADLFAANRELMKGLDVVVYKIDQDLVWNIGGARNLGFWMANTEWVFMNDADIEVKPDTMDFITDLVNKDYSNQTVAPIYLYFKRLKPEGFKNHPAVMLLKKEYYWILGGCDEDFVGNYGQTDPHFRLKAKLHPTLDGVTTEDLMNEQNISALIEMPDDPPCPIGMTCMEPYVGQKPSRDTKPNKDLIKKKRREGKWSNKCLRFTWKRDSWEPSSSWSWLSWTGWFK